MAILHDRSSSSSISEIRPRARLVAEQALHVMIAGERVALLADAFEMPEGPAGIGRPLDPELHHLGHGRDTVDYFVTLGALRFGSGYHPRLAKRAGWSVGQTLVACLSQRFETRGPFSSSELLRASKEGCAELFGQRMVEPAQAELMELFARALRDLGRFLNDRYDGSCMRLVESAGGSAVRLAESLTQMSYFSDVQRYRGLDVPFHLRAQRIAIDLAQAFEMRGPGAFDDLDRLAPSADNVVPHVLRMDNLLRYDRGLQERIERGEPVPAHSEREIEIRAAAIHGVELIVAELMRRGQHATTLHVDTWLRLRGRQPSYRAKPRHRSRTVLY